MERALGRKYYCIIYLQIIIFFISRRVPPTTLAFSTRYEKMMELFGKQGHFCETIPELQNAVKAALSVEDSPSIINIIISPSADRRPQTFAWLTESKL